MCIQGKFLNTSYYQDAVEERAIIKQCGFPVCPNQIKKVWKQQYCIDLRSKKVYDVTERKVFWYQLHTFIFGYIAYSGVLELLQ